MPFKPQHRYMWLIINYWYGLLMYWCIDLCHLEDRTHCSEQCINPWLYLKSLQRFSKEKSTCWNTDKFECWEYLSFPSTLWAELKKKKKSSFWIGQFVTFSEIISALCLAICFKMIEIISFYLLKRVQYCNRNILSCENAKFLSDLQLFKTPCF